MSPGCDRRSESTYTRRSAKRRRATPLSRPAPANSEGPSAAVTAPAGAAPLSAPTLPASVPLSRDDGAAGAASQRERSSSRVRTVASRAPSRDASSVSTPSTWTPPPSCVDCRSACVASAASVPSTRTGPVTAPASGSPPPGKLPRRPSNESESATTSANTASVSLRLSSRTTPRITLGGRSRGRCRNVPLNCASASRPVSVPAASSAPCSRTAGTSRRTVLRSIVAASTAKERKPTPAPRDRSTSPRPRTVDCGQPGTRESRNTQSVSRCSAPIAPSARVRPLRRPARGSLSRKGRANSRSKARASRSAARRATSPESAALSAVSRPVMVPPPEESVSGSSRISSKRPPWERSATPPCSTAPSGKRESTNRKSERVAESARAARSNSNVPRGQRTRPRAWSAEPGSRTRSRSASSESPTMVMRPATSRSSTAGSLLCTASPVMSIRIPRSRGEESRRAASRAVRWSKRRTRSGPSRAAASISWVGSGAGPARRRSITVPSSMRTLRNRISVAGPRGPCAVSGPPKRSSSSALSRPLGCCTMLKRGSRRASSNSTTRPAANSSGL